MRVSVSAKRLHEALERCLPVCKASGGIEWTSHVLLDARDGEFWVHADNLTLAVSVFVQADVEQDGRALVPGRILGQVAAAANGAVGLESSGSRLAVTGCGTWDLAGLFADDFAGSLTSPVVAAGAVSVDGAALARAVSSVSRAFGRPGQGETRAHIAGFLLQAVDGDAGRRLWATATDGHRICIADGGPWAGGDLCVVPPKAAAQALHDLLESGPVSLAVEGSFLRAVGHEAALGIRLVAGQFPDCSSFLPGVALGRGTTAPGELAAAMRRAGLVLSDKHPGAVLAAGDGQAVITAVNPDLGECVSRCPVEWTGEPIPGLVYNLKFLADGVAAADSDPVAIQYEGPDRPLFLLPAGDREWFCVFGVMPMAMER